MRLYEKFKAWRRDETMLSGVNRGRCFQKNNSINPNNSREFKAKPEIKLKMKVTRANGSIEEYDA